MVVHALYCMCMYVLPEKKEQKICHRSFRMRRAFLPGNGFTHPAMNLGVNLIDCCISLNAKATYPSSTKNWKRSGA